MKKKRILIIVENLPLPLDRRVWQEATTLKAAGYEVSIICPKGKGFTKAYEAIDDIHIYRHPLPHEAEGALGYLVEYSAALFWQFILAWRVFFARGFDVIQACNPPDTIFLVALPFKLLGRKFVFDHHDLNPELFQVKFGRKGPLLKLLYLFEKLTFRFSDVSLATNESYREIAVNRGKMPPERVFTVRSAPDLEKFRKTEPDQRLKNGRPHVVGYIGVMGNQDGVDVLLRAAETAVKELGRKDIQFVLIGNGPDFSNLQQLSRNLGLDDYVTFTGFLRGQELMAALSTIDIGVGPDESNDYNDKCTMNKVMEYMALGIPLVQFDLKEGRFSAQDAAVYAEKNDYRDLARKIVALADDKTMRDELGRKGRERMEQVLQWKYEAPKLLHAYDLVFDARPQQR